MPQSILNVGCGSGYLLRGLAARNPTAVRLSGIDQSAAMVAAAHAGWRPEVTSCSSTNSPSGSFQRWRRHRRHLEPCPVRRRELVTVRLRQGWRADDGDGLRSELGQVSTRDVVRPLGRSAARSCRVSPCPGAAGIRQVLSRAEGDLDSRVIGCVDDRVHPSHSGGRKAASRRSVFARYFVRALTRRPKTMRLQEAKSSASRYPGNLRLGAPRIGAPFDSPRVNFKSRPGRRRAGRPDLIPFECLLPFNHVLVLRPIRP